MSAVTVVLVTWNSSRTLPEVLAAVRRQTVPPQAAVVIDNASADGSAEAARAACPTALVLRNRRNLGFSRAVNQGIELTRTPYLLLLNPDVTLHPRCLAELLLAAAAYPAAAGLAPKLIRVPLDVELDPAGAPVGSVVRLDAAGLRMNRSRVAANRGEGEPDVGQYDRVEPVFGCPGACALFKRTALQAVAVQGAVFDEDFFAYKEDVDLAWRLQLNGFASYFVPTAVAYHRRRFRQPSGGVVAQLAARRAIPRRLRLLSFTNQHLMVVKNEQLANLWRDLAPITVQALKWLAVACTVEPSLWRVVLHLLRRMPAALRQRRIIQSRTKVAPAEIRRWFTTENSKSQNSKS